MDIHHVKGRSASSRAEALRIALENALELQRPPARTHLYLKDIVPTRKADRQEWLARLDVVSQAYNSTDREREKEKKLKHKQEEELHQHHVIDELHHRYQVLHDELYEDEEWLALYLETTYEDDFNLIRADFEFDAVHVLASEHLLLEQARHEPDLQMRIAAHRDHEEAIDYDAALKNPRAPAHELDLERARRLENGDDLEPE